MLLYLPESVVMALRYSPLGKDALVTNVEFVDVAVDKSEIERGGR
jgi:hypothetical protein